MFDKTQYVIEMTTGSRLVPFSCMHRRGQSGSIRKGRREVKTCAILMESEEAGLQGVDHRVVE